MNPLRSNLPLLGAAALSLVLLLFVDPANAAVNSLMGDQITDQPIFASATVHCDEMVSLHRWEGNCCSLNATAGNGCILNVQNGRCKVRGQVWTLDYNSTYDKKECPPSEYTWQMLGMKSDPNAVEEAGGVGAGPSGVVLWTAIAVGSGLFGILGL